MALCRCARAARSGLLNVCWPQPGRRLDLRDDPHLALGHPCVKALLRLGSGDRAAGVEEAPEKVEAFAVESSTDARSASACVMWPRLSPCTMKSARRGRACL